MSPNTTRCLFFFGSLIALAAGIAIEAQGPAAKASAPFLPACCASNT